MGHFFLLLYRFFRSRRYLPWILLGVLLTVSGFLASRIRLKEEISGTITHNTHRDRLSDVISHTRLADKIIVRIFSSDPAKVVPPEEMAGFATAFLDSLKGRYDSGYISTVIPDPQDTLVRYFLELAGKNLPVYLEPADYAVIDSLIRPESVRAQMKKDYRTLASPASLVMRPKIQADPLGFFGLAWNKLKTLQAGDQYTLSNGFLFTKDLKNVLLFITPSAPAGETSRNATLVRGIDQELRKLEARAPGLQAESWGGAVIAVGNAERLKKDIALTLIITLVLIFLLLSWYFRSLLVPLLGFLPALFGGLFSLATLYLLKGTVSAIALGIGAVLLGLIVDYALYILNRFRRTGSMESVLLEMSQTLVICAVTSIGAFLCLLFLDSSVLVDLGLFASLSLAGAVLFSLIFLPHFVTRSLVRPSADRASNIVDRICSISYEKKFWLSAILLVAGIVSTFFLSTVRFEQDMDALNYMEPAVEQAGNHLDRINEERLKTVFVTATGSSLAEALEAAHAAVPKLDSLHSMGVIRRTSGVQQLLLTDTEQEERLARWKAFWTPEKVKRVTEEVTKAASSLGMKPAAFNLFFASLTNPGTGLTRNDQDKLARSLFREWITLAPGMVMVSTNVRVSQELREQVYESFRNLPDVTVFDRQLITERFVEGVGNNFSRLVHLTMIFVTLLLILSFGRIELGLIASVPMFLSWLLTLGFMGMAGIRFNIFNIIISSFVFGLGVDYSILMMRGILYKYKYGLDEMSNYRVSVFLSSVTTLFGVGALFFARHPALHSISLISIVGIITVVMISWTLEPLVAKWMMLDRQDKRRFPLTLRIIYITLLVAWIPITAMAVILFIYGALISPLLPIRKRRKQQLFHWLFSRLSRLYIAANFPFHHKVENPSGETFEKPALIISNHQSLIETPALLRLHSNILILTREWIYRHWVFGPVARISGFIPIASGLEESLDLIQQRITDGFSVLIFPEGSRSRDGSIQRFHRGAFFVAERLQLDIVPIVIFGSGDFLRKGEFFGKPNELHMKILPRVEPSDMRFGHTYQDRARTLRKFYQEEYSAYKSRHGTVSYYRTALLLNYVFKGPVLEWYVRIKMMMEDNFRDYAEQMPVQGDILDLGCGYGYLSLLLAFTAPGRRVTGVDHDAEKIAVAQNCFSLMEQVTFICQDICTFPFGPQDGIILGDVLHYLSEEQQSALLERCVRNLRPGGILLIREGFRDREHGHGRTKLSEFFSTGMGFNKLPEESRHLYFMTEAAIRQFAAGYQLEVEIISSKKHSSNRLLLLRK